MNRGIGITGVYPQRLLLSVNSFCMGGITGRASTGACPYRAFRAYSSVKRCCASRYLAAVFCKMSSGKRGPGGVLSQSSVSR